MYEIVAKLVDKVKALWIAADSRSSVTRWPDDLNVSNSAQKLAPAGEKNCGMADAVKQPNIAFVSVGSTGGISCKLAIYLHRRKDWPAFSG